MMALVKVKPVKVSCRNCGSEAFADDFKLDAIKGMMVCPECNKKPSVKMIQETVEENGVDEKPLGWDEVDDYLEKAYKKKESPVKTCASEDGYINYVCKKCEYKFRHNTLKNWPNFCPSCGREVNR